MLRAIAAARPAHPVPGSAPAASGTTRRRFLQIGMGGLIAAGILVGGAGPAGADPVAAWVRANRDRLPRTYPELVALPAAYRAAIYQELTATERSAAWVQHLTAGRASLPSATAEQSAILDQALALAADPAHFAEGSAVPAAADDLTRRAIDAFGIDRARALFATLGPADTATAETVTCECSVISDYCDGHCIAGGCTPYGPACGFLWQYICTGMCS